MGVYGTRINPDGALLDGPSNTGGVAIYIPLATAIVSSRFVTAAYDGTGYFVSWAIGSFPNSPPAGIFAARVSTTGQLIDGPPETGGITISDLRETRGLDRPLRAKNRV